MNSMALLSRVPSGTTKTVSAIAGVAILALALFVGLILPSFPIAQSLQLTLVMIVAIVVFLVMAGYGVRGLTLLLLAAGTCFLGLTGIRISASLAVSDLFWFAAIGLTLLVALLVRPTRLDFTSPVIRGVLILNLGAFIAGLFSPELVESQIRLLKMATATLLIPTVILFWRLRPKEIRLLSWLWLMSVVVSCLYALVNGPDAYSVRSSGLTTHPNNLGLSAVLTLGPALAFTVSGQRIGQVIGSICTLILLGGVMMSGSRAALLGTGAATLAFALLLRQRKVFIGLGVAALVAVTIVGTGLYEPPGVALDRLFGDEQSSYGVAESNEGRMAQLQGSINRMLERPIIGWGLAQARAAHNVYLQVLESSGVIGFIGFIMVILASLKPVIQATANRPIAISNQNVVLAIGLSAGLIGFLVAELFSNVLWERFLWFHIALLVSATSASVTKSLPPPGRPKAVGRVITGNPKRSTI